MERTVQPEQLDHLQTDDPRAIASRRDLRRINACMGNARLTAAAILAQANGELPIRLVDLGAGDGHSLLQLMRHLPPLPHGLEVVLVDRSRSAPDQVVESLGANGFRPKVEEADVLDWLSTTPAQPGTWIVANLFLHHFTRTQLVDLFTLARDKSVLLCACEPRRGALPLAFTYLLRLIGANAVTRHDAAVSVRAGFIDDELSQLWPRSADWRLNEHRAGLFSHLFVAKKVPLRAHG